VCVFTHYTGVKKCVFTHYTKPDHDECIYPHTQRVVVRACVCVCVCERERERERERDLTYIALVPLSIKSRFVNTPNVRSPMQFTNMDS